MTSVRTQIGGITFTYKINTRETSRTFFAPHSLDGKRFPYFCTIELVAGKGDDDTASRISADGIYNPQTEQFTRLMVYPKLGVDMARDFNSLSAECSLSVDEFRRLANEMQEVGYLADKVEEFLKDPKIREECERAIDGAMKSLSKVGS